MEMSTKKTQIFRDKPGDLGKLRTVIGGYIRIFFQLDC